MINASTECAFSIVCIFQCKAVQVQMRTQWLASHGGRPKLEVKVKSNRKSRLQSTRDATWLKVDKGHGHRCTTPSYRSYGATTQTGFRDRELARQNDAHEHWPTSWRRGAEGIR